MTNATQFRIALPADAEALAGLHTLSWQRNYRGILPDTVLDGALYDEHLAVWRKRLSSSTPERQFFLLAVQEDAVVGFVSVLLDLDPEWGARLENLHVHPRNQGRGLGRELLQRARAWVAGAAPGQPLHLWVLAANAPALAFYDRLGGRAVQNNLWELPSGHKVSEIRYQWPTRAAGTGG
ncbi:MAG: GNAT family N-acetyltransferase [Betaproteobacteria bacterium]|nr:GNAT family N-acetyltransferase [Betaproteobacteria bacterium]